MADLVGRGDSRDSPARAPAVTISPVALQAQESVYYDAYENPPTAANSRQTSNNLNKLSNGSANQHSPSTLLDANYDNNFSGVAESNGASNDSPNMSEDQRTTGQTNNGASFNSVVSGRVMSDRSDSFELTTVETFAERNVAKYNLYGDKFSQTVVESRVESSRNLDAASDFPTPNSTRGSFNDGKRDTTMPGVSSGDDTFGQVSDATGRQRAADNGGNRLPVPTEKDEISRSLLDNTISDGKSNLAPNYRTKNASITSANNQQPSSSFNGKTAGDDDERAHRPLIIESADVNDFAQPRDDVTSKDSPSTVRAQSQTKDSSKIAAKAPEENVGRTKSAHLPKHNATSAPQKESQEPLAAEKEQSPPRTPVNRSSENNNNHAEPDQSTDKVNATSLDLPGKNEEKAENVSAHSDIDKNNETEKSFDRYTGAFETAAHDFSRVNSGAEKRSLAGNVEVTNNNDTFELSDSTSDNKPADMLSRAESVNAPAKLPLYQMCGGGWQLAQYKGVWLMDKHVDAARALPTYGLNIAANASFIINSYPRSGTTWVKAAVAAMFSSDPEVAFKQNVHKIIPCIEDEGENIASVQPWRMIQTPECTAEVLHTHFPMSLWPAQFFTANVAVIYIYRNSKDCALSNYHFMHGLQIGKSSAYTGTINEYVDEIIAGKTWYGPYVHHISDAIKFGRNRFGNRFLLINYDDAMKNQREALKMIRNFMIRSMGMEKHSNEKDLTKADFKHHISLPHHSSHHFSFPHLHLHSKERRVSGSGSDQLTELKTPPGMLIHSVDHVLPIVTFESMSKSEANQMVNEPEAWSTSKGKFIRRALVGGWRDELSAQNGMKLDEYVQESAPFCGLPEDIAERL